MIKRSVNVRRDVLNMPRLRISPLMDLTPKESKYKSPRKATNRAGNVYLSILSSPERLCLLTQKVLPRDFMIKFQLVKSSGTATTKPLTYFVPTGILHPRFAPSASGKAAYVVCWKEAVQLVSMKGSYKRLSSSATMLTHTSSKISSHFSRRVMQEIEMFGERVKGASSVLKTSWRGVGLRRCPVERLTLEEIELVKLGSVSGIRQDGGELVAIISLDESVILTSDDQFSALLPRNLSSESTLIPIYNMARLLDSIVIPVIPATGTFSNKGLADQARVHLDRVIDLFARREMRHVVSGSLPVLEPMLTSSGTTKRAAITTKINVGNAEEALVRMGVYAIYDPIAASSEVTALKGDQDPAKFSMPLLLSLWRCRLWEGEGWQGNGEGFDSGGYWTT